MFGKIGFISEDGMIDWGDGFTCTATLEPITFQWIFGKDIKVIPTTDIDHVLFNNPATIIFWKDGTKTVVKCQEGDEFDEEIGFACCYLKRVLGSKGYTKFCKALNDIWEKKHDRIYQEMLEKRMKEKVEEKKCKCPKTYHVDIHGPIIL